VGSADRPTRQQTPGRGGYIAQPTMVATITINIIMMR
jgi:hypothetical protein